MGRNCARDDRHAQLLLADDQRQGLLRQAAWLVLAGGGLVVAHGRNERDGSAYPVRARGRFGSGADGGDREAALRPAHRSPRAFSAQRRPARWRVGRWALANHGRDLTHQGAARIRPAGADYRDVFVSRRRVERAWTAAIAWRARRTNQMDRQPQSMVLQLAHG